MNLTAMHTLISFFPFLVLFLIALDIVSRNRRHRKHRLTGLLVLSLALLYLGDYLRFAVASESVAERIENAKTMDVFLVMSLSVYFFYLISRPTGAIGRKHILFLLPLAGAVAMLAFPDRFHVSLGSDYGGRSYEHYSAALKAVVYSFAMYSFIGAFFSLYGARKRALESGLKNAYGRIKVMQLSCLGSFVYLLASLAASDALERAGHPEYGFLPMYCILIWVVGVRYAMNKYGFLASESRQYKLLFELSDQGIVLIDEHGRILDANPAFRRLTGAGPGRTFQDQVRDRRRETFLSVYREHYGRFAPFRHETELVGASGETRVVELTCEHLEMESRLLSFLLVRDVTEQRNRERMLARLAFLDPLTGICNRRQFMELLELALGEAKERGSGGIALLFVDLDHFKNVNDTYGHDCGDQLLKHVSQTLQNHLPDGGAAGRIGGDEFALFLPAKAGGAAPEELAARLVQAFEQPILLKGTIYKLSLSIGISRSDSDGSNAQELLEHADQAMYMAKKGGRNGYRVYCNCGTIS